MRKNYQSSARKAKRNQERNKIEAAKEEKLVNDTLRAYLTEFFLFRANQQDREGQAVADKYEELKERWNKFCHRKWEFFQPYPKGFPRGVEKYLAELKEAEKHLLQPEQIQSEMAKILQEKYGDQSGQSDPTNSTEDRKEDTTTNT